MGYLSGIDKKGKFEEEDRKLRRKILQEIATHDYDGGYDLIEELVGKLYITGEESLEFADILNVCSVCAKATADVYYQYGEDNKYVRYLVLLGWRYT